jgi:methylated-DNA-[protein]-cysteine S-methyltransferase
MLMYTAVPSPFGPLTVAWESALGDRPPVRRIYFPSDPLPPDAPLPPFPAETTHWPAPVSALIDSLARYLAGEALVFDLAPLDLGLCTPFQQRVLRAEFAVPRGEVTTYGLLAAHIGAPRAARAAGSALGRNPFPVIIPCHRAVHADGALGGYRGGLALKRALLEMEGLTFAPNGAVRVTRFWYDPIPAGSPLLLAGTPSLVYTAPTNAGAASPTIPCLEADREDHQDRDVQVLDRLVQLALGQGFYRRGALRLG